MRSDIRSQLLNRWILFLKRFNRPKKISSKKVPSKILVISTTGIGDTLWGTPAFLALKNRFPSSHLAVLTSPLGYQVLKNNPHIDAFFQIKRAGLSLLGLFLKLRREKFDTIFVFHISYRWIIPFCYFLAPQNLIGFKRHAKSFANLLSEPFEVGLRHPILQRLSLIETIGAPAVDHQIRLFLTQQELKVADKFLSKHSLNQSSLIIGLQPGASQPFKQWPVGHFIELAKKLHEKASVKMVVFGNKEEEKLAHEINEAVPIIIAAGKLSLRQSSALLSKMTLFISNDTGPMHLALAQQVPLVSIFSPTAHDLCWPHLKAPWVRLVTKPKTCEVCIGHRCHKPYCMERITPQEVFNQVEELLKTL